MIGFAGPVEFKQLPVFRRHRRQSGRGGELLRLFRRGHRFRETAGFGISGGQRPDEQGFAMMSQLTRAFGQTDRLGPMAQPGIGTGGQHPRQVVQRPGQVGIQSQRLPVLGHRFPGAARLAKGHAQMKEGFGEVWIDLDRLAIVPDRFIKPALGGEGDTQIVQRFGIIRIDPDGLAIVLDRFIKPALGARATPRLYSASEKFGLIWMA